MAVQLFNLEKDDSQRIEFEKIYLLKQSRVFLKYFLFFNVKPYIFSVFENTSI